MIGIFFLDHGTVSPIPFTMLSVPIFQALLKRVIGKLQSAKLSKLHLSIGLA